jgi:hypothetical protein
LDEITFHQFGGISCSCLVSNKLFFAFSSLRLIYMWDVNVCVDIYDSSHKIKSREHKRTVRIGDTKLVEEDKIKCMTPFQEYLLVAINKHVYEIDLVVTLLIITLFKFVDLESAYCADYKS